MGAGVVGVAGKLVEARRGLLLGDAEVSEAGLQRVAASFPAGEAGSADHGVVGARGRGKAVVSAGLVEGFDDDGAGDTPVRGDGESAVGMVV